MPKHGTYTVNNTKDHDNLHELFLQGILGSCWCACRKCWNSQKVMGTCYQDFRNSQRLSEIPIIGPEMKHLISTGQRQNSNFAPGRRF